MKKFEAWASDMPRVFTPKPIPGEGEDSVLIGVRSRDPPSVVSSATSSNASVATTASTSALLPLKVKKYLGGKGGSTRAEREQTQRDLNILLASQTEAVSKKGMEGKGELLENPAINRDDELGQTKSSTIRQVLAALAVSLGSLVVGFSNAYTGSALVSMKQPDSGLTISTSDESWIGSLMPLFALVGGIAGGPLIETLGRRATILLTAFPFITAFALIASANDVWMVLAGRALTGLGVGIASLALPVYLGETVEARVRGTLGLLPTTLGNLGMLMVFSAGSFLNWSNLALFGACLPIPFLVATCFIPESPIWYVAHGKDQEAQDSLQWLRGKKANVTDELRTVVKAQKDMDSGDMVNIVKDLFSKRNLKPFFICIGLMFFQQFSGINAVIFYIEPIFKESGSSISSNVCSIIVGVVNLASTLLATVLIDKLGRKMLLYISNGLMATSLAIVSVFFYLQHEKYDLQAFGWIPLSSFVIYIFAFSIGAGPIPWLMMGEILPAKIRGAAASMVTAFNWTCTFVVTKGFVDAKNAFGPHFTFIGFCLICVSGIVFTVYCVPETRGKTLEEIEEQLTGKKITSSRSSSRARSISLAKLKPFPSMI